MYEQHDRKNFRIAIFLVCSIVIHLGLFAYLAYRYYDDVMNALALTKKQSQILVDLTDPRDDIVDPNEKVVSRYNYAGKGKLVPEKGQHLAGNFNPRTHSEQTSLTPPEINQQLSSASESSSRKLFSANGEIAISPSQPKPKKPKSQTENTESTEVSKKQNKQSTKTDSVSQKPKTSTDEQRLSVDTEDTLENRFWFDESDFLQINSKIHPDAEFSLELANLLKKRFATYVLGGGAINFFYVKRDQATALAKIDRNGRISFERIVSPSKIQPYLNYLVSRVIDNPGVVKNLPKELRDEVQAQSFKKKNSKGVEELTFLFNISFTGEPLRKWWMGFDFYPPNNPRN